MSQDSPTRLAPETRHEPCLVRLSAHAHTRSVFEADQPVKSPRRQGISDRLASLDFSSRSLRQVVQVSACCDLLTLVEIAVPPNQTPLGIVATLSRVRFPQQPPPHGSSPTFRNLPTTANRGELRAGPWRDTSLGMTHYPAKPSARCAPIRLAWPRREQCSRQCAGWSQGAPAGRGAGAVRTPAGRTTPATVAGSA